MNRYIDESILVDKVYDDEGLPTISRSVLVNCVLPTIPTADVRENVKGEWKIEYTGDGWNDYIDVTCTNCGKTIKRGELYNFCPNCGADMRGKHE